MGPILATPSFIIYKIYYKQILLVLKKLKSTCIVDLLIKTTLPYRQSRKGFNGL